MGSPGVVLCRRDRKRRAPAVLDPLDDVIKNRRQENAEQRDAEHAGEHGGAQSAAHLGARADRNHERDYAEDEGETGHDDGPEPQLASRQRRLEARFARFALRLSEFHDQNRILAGQTHQHQETDLRKDVNVHPGKHDARDGT